MKKNVFITFLVYVYICGNMLVFFPYTVRALTTVELQTQIDAKRKEKEKLDAENIRLQIQIQETGKQAQTLQNTVKVLDTTQKKLQNDIQVTQNKIVGTTLTIDQLTIEINKTIQKIERDKSAIGEAFRNMALAEDKSMVENMLEYKTLGEIWNDLETVQRFQQSLRTRVNDLSNLEKDYGKKKIDFEGKKSDLVNFKGELADRKVIVLQNKQAKSTLLVQTKSKEVLYKELLARNTELGKKFEQELFDYESQLKIQIDQSRIPTRRSGILFWPLDSIKISQRFGATVDSKRLYVSGTHNGVDFGIPVGTPVKSISDGVVEGSGNTDLQSGCYSYGRWILIKHSNGLSSLYAHLSFSKVSVGQSVNTGDVVGYSGGQPGSNGSGYSTGPHLHLTLLASQGVSVQQYTQSKFCKQVKIPIAGANAYLDPLAYLPTL